MDQTPPRIRILKQGTFRSVEGKTVTFGAADLAAIAAGYDADSDPAPLVIGHPEMDDPAYGWVGSLAVEDGELVARPDRISPAFAERVRQGDYRKVSARLYEPAHPHNPKPGNWYLKHVGFLGAHAAGIKGLGTVQFAECEPGEAITIHTEPETEKEPAMATPTATPSAQTAAPAETAPAQTASAATSPNESSFAERSAALDRREADIAKREADQAKAAKAARHAANVSFAEGLIGEAKLAPAGKDLVIGVLDALGELETDAEVSFGEGDAAKSLSPDAALKTLLSGGGTIVSLGESAKPEAKGAASVSTGFAAPPGYTVDQDQAALHAEATKIRSATPAKPWMDCVREAQASLAS
ncbi:hypothetical protein QQS45_00070 [Alteriqipengyuania flavescens]|uniref:hypothetical protein n=1 Tax=Alteriqipengyuania flavescens TaxID=3053610 RepID=UPI0025B550D2|nr:hypothetical protein [Alteriqipengyuania flavescens]WJY18685.1 hypothetical protein QQW98_00070 [Alteriqipengyuania flavescens]WJY24625.1 hypothetical protein QQS45_00070 [Alteriqipengyuania flavescens]